MSGAMLSTSRAAQHHRRGSSISKPASPGAGMTRRQDLEMIRGTVTNQIHGKPVGTAASWSNPASGNSGFIKLGKKLTRKKQQCEEIEYTVRSGGTPVYTEHYHFISCLQPDGTWKIA